MGTPTGSGATPVPPSAGPSQRPDPAASAEATSPPTGGSRASGSSRYPAGIYPPDVLEEGRGTSAGAGAAVVLAVIVVMLLVLMVTGYNNSIPFLHPTNASVTVIGDHLNESLLFVSNGSRASSTTSELCPMCPLAVTAGSQFSYTVTLANAFNGSGEALNLEGMVAFSPFQLDSYSPSSVSVAPGLTVSESLTLTAPSSGGDYAVTIVASMDVG